MGADITQVEVQITSAVVADTKLSVEVRPEGVFVTADAGEAGPFGPQPKLHGHLTREEAQALFAVLGNALQDGDDA